MRIGDTITENGKRGRITAFRPQGMVDVVFDGSDYPIRRPASSLHVVRENPKKGTFVAAKLTPASRKALLRWWQTLPATPDMLPLSRASHVLLDAHPTDATLATLPFGTRIQLQVTGWTGNKRLQLVRVAPVGATTQQRHPVVVLAVAVPAVTQAEVADQAAKAGGQTVAGPLLDATLAWFDGTELNTGPYHVGSGPQGGLSVAERASLDETAFARPGRRWPIHDAHHAKIALQYMKRGWGNTQDYPAIQKAIHARYPTLANPGADDVYDPAKEQFRAVVQGVYESLIRKHVGVASSAAFQQGRARLDDAVDVETRRQLLSRAYAIATRQGQKHGWLEPGTQTPTARGREAAKARLQNTQHAAENRQDYEVTLSAVRKSGAFRIVEEHAFDGRGRRVTHYVIQPRPAHVSIPAFRLSRAAAEQDLALVLGRVEVRRNPAHWVVDYEHDLQQAVTRFTQLTDAAAAAEATAALHAIRAARDSSVQGEPPAIAVRLLDAKLAARAADGEAVPFPTFAAGDAQLPRVRPVAASARRAALARDEATISTLHADKVIPAHPGHASEIADALSAAETAWLAFRDRFETDLYRGATEGSKIGGLAGSQKNKQDAAEPRERFDQALETLNAALQKAGYSAITDAYFAAQHPFRVFQAALASHQGGTKDIDVSAIPEDWPIQEGATRFTQAPLSGITLRVIERAKSSLQQTPKDVSLDRRAEERDVSKANDARSKRTVREPYWNVEQTLVLYETDSNQRRKYYTYVLKPDDLKTAPGETEQHALARLFDRLGFHPEPDAQNEIEWPEVRTRYVLYIPRTPIFMPEQRYAGGTQVLSETAYRGRAGSSNIRAAGPFMQGAKGVRLYPSMRLAKFFQVDASGVGGEDKLKATQELAVQADASHALSTFLDTIGTEIASRLTPVDTDEMMRLALQGRKAPDAQTQKKPRFLSPEDNWVKYSKESALFNRLRKGVRDPITGEFEGGDRDAVLFDVFYTYSPQLAYLTITFFNTPELMGHLDAIPKRFQNAVVVPPPEAAFTQAAHIEEMRQTAARMHSTSQLRPIVVHPASVDAVLAQMPQVRALGSRQTAQAELLAENVLERAGTAHGYLGYTPELTAPFVWQATRRKDATLQPIKPASAFGIPLTLAESAWNDDPLHMLLTERELQAVTASIAGLDATTRALDAATARLRAYQQEQDEAKAKAEAKTSTSGPIAAQPSAKSPFRNLFGPKKNPYSRMR